MTPQETSHRGFRSALSLAAGALWGIPGSFGIAGLLGPSYSLRCIVFHDIAPAESPFTKGMGVSATPETLETVLRFVAAHYEPVSLQDFLQATEDRPLPPRSLLLTFDDGYASVMESAVPLCRQLGLPAVFFVNAAFLDNRLLAPDNLVCYLANTSGMEVINAAARVVKGNDTPELLSQTDVYASFFPSLSCSEREAFLAALATVGGIHECELASQSRLYLTRQQLRELASQGFEIGNHTYSHVRCRSLTAADLEREILGNKTELETVTGKKVRSFSLPYGASADLTPDLERYLQSCGCEAVFLSQGVANPRYAKRFVDRVGASSHCDDDLFLQIEVLPRLRALRARLSSGART